MPEIIKHIFDTSYNDINQYILKINLKDKFVNSSNQFAKQYISPCFDVSLCENIIKEYDYLYENNTNKNIDIMSFSYFSKVLTILNDKIPEIIKFFNFDQNSMEAIQKQLVFSYETNQIFEKSANNAMQKSLIFQSFSKEKNSCIHLFDCFYLSCFYQLSSC